MFLNELIQFGEDVATSHYLQHHIIHTRQLDNKILAVPLWKSVEPQRRSVY